MPLIAPRMVPRFFFRIVQLKRRNSKIKVDKFSIKNSSASNKFNILYIYIKRQVQVSQTYPYTSLANFAKQNSPILLPPSKLNSLEIHLSTLGKSFSASVQPASEKDISAWRRSTIRIPRSGGRKEGSRARPSAAG